MIKHAEKEMEATAEITKNSPHASHANVKKHEPKQTKYDLIVFCHLRWDFVFQRPQHLITRLAESYNILIVEEPVGYTEGEKNTTNVKQISNNITVLQPRVNTIEEIGEVLKNHLDGDQLPMAWFYSAAFIPVLQSLTFCKIIYDCMDELSLFKGAPQQLITQEKELISKADLVFTGGKSLYDSKRRFKTQTYCFPSSVDRSHFDISDENIELPEDIASLPKPVIGYYGVIDERIDYKLLKETALANPGCSFVMIGPLAKITPEELPELDNLYFLGMRSYNQLPAYLQGFDIAMMPFAMNDATKYISPTKTLEYMAGGKPVISTPVQDVVRDYNHCVRIVATSEDLTEAIKRISNDEAKTYLQAYASILEATSWDATAKHMIELIKTESTL